MTTAEKTVLILGAASDIGRAVAERFAADGYTVILAARDAVRLTQESDHLQNNARFHAQIAVFDILDTAGHSRFLDDLGVTPEIVVCVVGYSGDQTAAQIDPVAADLVYRTNLMGPAALLNEIANRMEQRGSGTIVGISSVSGERGRAKNYVYGSAKAGFTALLSGLRQRLWRRGVHVVTVIAGYCNTRKSAGLKRPRLLTADPHQVAGAVALAVAKKRNVIYVKPVWRPIMAFIRFIPERFFKRLSF